MKFWLIAVVVIIAVAAAIITLQITNGRGIAGNSKGKDTAKMSEVTEVTQDTFEQEILKSDKPVLVDFWAPWCGPCRMLSPIVDELAKDYNGKMKFAKVNTDANGGIAGQYGIRGIPTLMFFKDGKEIDRIVGVQPKPALVAKIDGIVGNGK
jgi:thioredoxin 1